MFNSNYDKAEHYDYDDVYSDNDSIDVYDDILS